MIQPVLALPDSPARLAALYRTVLLDTPAEEAFDRLTRLAARLLGAPVSLVSLLDQDRQFIKSASGLSGSWASRRSVPASYGFCQHVVRSGQPFVVEDARREPLTRQNVAVRELGWIAYLGVPLTTRDGHTIGAMSVIDIIPRLWSERDAELLQDLAASVVTEIELRVALALAAREAKPTEAPPAPASLSTEHDEPFADPFADAGVGIAVLSVDGRWLRVNRAFGELLGVDPAELVGRPVGEVTHADDVAAEQEALRLLRAGECRSYQAERRYRHSSGRVVPALVTVRVVHRADGEPDHLVAVAQEVAERPQPAPASRESEVIRDWDLPADLMSWLAGPGMLFGYEAAALGSTAAGWYERLHASDRERVVAGIAAALSRSERTWSDAYRFRRADGTYAHVRDRGVIMYDGDVPTRLVVAMVEVGAATARGPDVADHLHQMQKMEAVGQLAGGIAHDFNNLLTGILSYCDLILQELRQDDPIRGDVDQIRQAGQRAATLTRQLLAFSRRQVLQPRVLSLNGVVEGLDGMLRRVLGAAVTLETELEPALWYVLADPGQVEQVIVNLVVNARDAILAAPEGSGRVTIATANTQLAMTVQERPDALRPGDYVMLSVSDTGIGMDQTTQGRIFEPFFTTKEQGKGTGLGLSTVFGIVQQSGGDIAVESAPGKGATFRVYLPRHTGPPDAMPRPSRRTVPGGTETVLLVEDEGAVRTSVRRLLERHGYTVLEARHGADALRIFEANEARIDVVLTDIVMPEMGGLELVERLRVRQPGLKVLFMSGYTEQAIAADGVMPADTGFLEKPFTVDGLMRRVREVLDGGTTPR